MFSVALSLDGQKEIMRPFSPFVFSFFYTVSQFFSCLLTVSSTVLLTHSINEDDDDDYDDDDTFTNSDDGTAIISIRFCQILSLWYRFSTDHPSKRNRWERRK